MANRLIPIPMAPTLAMPTPRKKKHRKEFNQLFSIPQLGKNGKQKSMEN